MLVIPANAGIQADNVSVVEGEATTLGPRLRGDDGVMATIMDPTSVEITMQEQRPWIPAFAGMTT